MPRAQAQQPGTAAAAFPQGVASGDPTPNTVILWTRAEPTDAARDALDILMQVSETEDFARVIVEETVVAERRFDYVVKVKATKLRPDTRYHFRFGVEGRAPFTAGRTRTAPTADSTRDVRLAFASCQGYQNGFFDAWAWLVERDQAAPDNEQLDFVLHLGDFIYEHIYPTGVRPIAPFPDAQAQMPAGSYVTATLPIPAQTLDDYRHLYRTYLTDPDLQAARARFPFVCIWDDHEFSNDCWQSFSNYGWDDKPEQRRRVAAMRAWFDFIPADVDWNAATAAGDGLAPLLPAFDQAMMPLDADGRVGGSSRAATDVLKVYRDFRWGRNLHLIVPDCRSYRSDHPLPEAVAKGFVKHARAGLPVSLIETLDAGKTANGGNPPVKISYGDHTIDNPRRESSPGSVLGPVQKQWLKETLQASKAIWKVCGFSIPMMPLRVDFDFINGAAPDEICTITADAWEGYPSERQELLRFLADRRIDNVVSLSGDHHMHFAGALAVDEGGAPVLAEFVTAGISSNSMCDVLALGAKALNLTAAAPLIRGPARGHAAWEGKDQPILNVTILHGRRIAEAVVAGEVSALAEPRSQNRHLTYIDSDSYGIAIARFGKVDADVTHVTFAPPVKPRDMSLEPLYTARFDMRAADAKRALGLDPPRFTGAPPFPFNGA